MDEINKKLKEGFLGQRMVVLPPDVQHTIKQNPMIKNLFLTAIGFYPNAAYHDRLREEGCQEYILLYCASGRGELFLNGKRHQVVPNSYVILPKQVKHHYKSSLSSPWSIYWIHFIGESSDALYARYLESDVYSGPRLIALDEKRNSLFFKMLDFLETGFDEIKLEAVNIFLNYYLGSIIYQGIEENTEVVDTVSTSIQYMKDKIDEKLDLKTLAEHQHLSVSRYSKLFKKKTGTSPMLFLLKLKVQKSCQFLYFTDLSIKEISQKVGFTDPLYFSRAFKKINGMSPSRYKTMHKSKRN